MPAAQAIAFRASPTRRQLLQKATGDVHEAMHRLPMFESLLAGQPTRAGYAAVLRGFHRFHGGAVEVERAAGAAVGDDAAPAAGLQRIAALEADLSVLGQSPAMSRPRPRSACTAWNLGYCYVTRGSALGGRILHRALDGAPHWARSARSFFAPSAATTAAWRLLCEALECSPGIDGYEDRLVDGAMTAFADFRLCVEERCA